jgi:hypothetical protein
MKGTDQFLEKSQRVDMGAPLRLVVMGWTALLLLYFLPLIWWGIILKFLSGIFLVALIIGSFQPVWDRYVTMGAFLTMQVAWFALFLWVPDYLVFLRYVLSLLIVLGIFTKFKQIQHINKGLGPDLRKKS